jgi:hypothetical protein
MLGLILAIVSAAAMGIAVWALAQRLSHRNTDMVRLVGRVTGTTEITYKGHECRVEILGGEGDVPGTMRVHWRGHTIDYPMWTRPNKEGEALEPHKDWFGVMVLADGAEDTGSLRSNWTGENGPRTRLIVAARYPAEGFDPGSWGLVRRKEWHYRLAVLHTDGPDDAAVEQWDKSYEELDAIFLPGKYTSGWFIPKSDAERLDKLWMFYAMLEVTPPMHYRGRDKGSEAVIASMGWPWPVAAAGCMGMLAGIAIWVAGGIKRPHAA